MTGALMVAGERARGAQGRRAPLWVWVVVTAAAYCVLARLSLLLVFSPEKIAAFWPGSGLACVAYLKAPDRARRIGVVAGVGLGCLLADLAANLGWSSGLFPLINCVEVLVTGSLVQRWIGGKPLDFGHVGQITSLLCGSVIGTGVSAVGGAVVAVWLMESPSFWWAWREWMVGDTLGIVIAAPLLQAMWQGRHVMARLVKWEFGLALGFTTLVTHVVFSGDMGTRPMLMTYPLFLLFPIMLWTGLRLPVEASSITGVLMSTVAAAYTVMGSGPFGRPEQTHSEQVMTLQVGMLAWTLCSLFLAAMMEQGRRATTAARESAALAMETAGELARSQQMYRSVVENVKEVIFQTDATGRWTFLNPAWKEITGFSVGESLGKVFLQYVHPDDVPAGVETFAPLMNGEKPACREQVRYVTRGGGFRWIEVYAQATRDGAGKVSGTSGTLTDVTERRTAEAALRTAKEAAEAASVAKSRFLAQMSHEIRTPLTSILGYADLLERSGGRGAREEPFGDAVQTIRRNGEHLLAVINDILDLSKIEADRMTVERVPTHIGALLGEVASVMGQRARAKQLGFEVRFVTPVPETFRSDPTRLRQILFNLIGNAVKFTQTGGICVRLGQQPGKGDEGVLTIEVQDTGIGMTEEQIGRLFAPFAQGDTSHARLFGGTGLGLSISRSLARLLGGDIRIVSEPGMGSSFSLRIPLGEGTSATTIAAVPAAGAGRVDGAAGGVQLRGRILVVDDNPDVQRLVMAYLQQSGVTLETAASGPEAVAKVWEAVGAGRPFDLVLMDGQMPGMDGVEATQTLRAEGYKGAVAALTANAMTEDRERWQQAGASAFLTKPIDIGTFFHTVGKFVPLAEPAERPTAGPARPRVVNGLLEDAVLGRLVREFQAGLGAKEAALRAAAAAGDKAELGRLAHQLKGSGGSYGFPGISAAAVALELAARGGGSMEGMEGALAGLLEACQEAGAAVAA